MSMTPIEKSIPLVINVETRQDEDGLWWWRLRINEWPAIPSGQEHRAESQEQAVSMAAAHMASALLHASNLFNAQTDEERVWGA